MDTLEQTDRERIVEAIVQRRRYVAQGLGCWDDDLRQVGHLAALEAEASWDAEAGRSLSSWVWINVEWEVNKVLTRGRRNLERAAPEREVAVPSGETALVVRRALDYLQARLPGLDWTLLWLRHAEGYAPREIGPQMGMTARYAAWRLVEAKKRASHILSRGGIAGEWTRTTTDRE